MRQIHRLRDTEEFAGRDVADDGLVPLRRDLFDAKMAVQQEIKMIGFGALIEDGAVFRISNRARFPQHFVLLGGGKAREHGKVRDQGAVDGGHRDPHFQCLRRLSAAGASLNGSPSP